ncbi:MAG: DUF4179 domain-containing protein [Aminipila sp.]
MKQFKQDLSIPLELDKAINEGIKKGRIKMEKNNAVRKRVMGVAAAAVIGVGLFGVGVNVSPAFADSIKDVPVLGTLVEVFQMNKENVSGGKAEAHSKGEISLSREEGKERLIINFADSENANKYDATYLKNPQSITITLPGSTDVKLLSDYKRSEGESDFIKSVYKLTTLDDSMLRYVVEIEDYSDVQISEYKNPGQIVVELTKNENYDFEEIYSVRSYSFDDGEEFAVVEENLGKETHRILKDEQESRFIEFAQFATKEKAQAFAKEVGGIETVIEKRYGNNVPVCFKTKADYDEYCFVLDYTKVLNKAVDVEDITTFIDKNKDKYPQYAEIMVKGLTGMLRSMDQSEYNAKDYDKYYALIGTTTEKELAKY